MPREIISLCFRTSLCALNIWMVFIIGIFLYLFLASAALSWPISLSCLSRSNLIISSVSASVILLFFSPFMEMTEAEKMFLESWIFLSSSSRSMIFFLRSSCRRSTEEYWACWIWGGCSIYLKVRVNRIRRFQLSVTNVYFVTSFKL